MTQTRLNLIALLCLLALGVALISQHVFDMPPCAWCVLQRLILLVIAAVCLLANLVPGTIKRLIALLTFALTIAGIVAAWYQYTVAAEMVSCDRTFADIFMSKTTGLDGMVPWLFGIYATCMDAKVSVLGVEYVLWALLLFVVLLGLSAYALFGNTRGRSRLA
ncbi:disulfide bond formation protein B [Advenella mimigardefordensis]|uniref:Putative disulfide bond formation protein DsbB n=1 Tax=Advenella mimigardefordensis (strain DSM 17166 / LMG 22922 / DPN7) TaxID=1247726 RepID=W0PAX4_ADVMD|nr:disulfide bond formation protein B [Advenella mimigardefordensis]AHG64009.1 putative disulfide bond formation protein DsbB [Advenella mimigardefordensis DPN7]